MNWYYAKNGVQHGPVPLETLVDKISMGEVAPTDLAWREGLADWAPVSTIAELKPKAPEPVEAPASAGVPTAHPEPYRPPVSAAPAGPSPVAPAPVGAPQSTGLATGSMICGILALLGCCLWPVSGPLAIVAIVLGHVALSRIKADPSRFGGNGMAKAGLVTGYLGIIAAIAMAIVGVWWASNPDAAIDMMEQWLPEDQRQEFRQKMEEEMNRRGTKP